MTETVGMRVGPWAPLVGRFLALRPDYFAAVDRDWLLELGDAPPVATLPGVRAAVAASVPELAELETLPVRATPLAQVHRGALADGTPVDVKTVPPEARSAVASFLADLTKLEATLPRGALDGVAVWLDRQLDLGAELANLLRFRALAATSPWEHVPRPYPDLCSPTTLVTEAVDGLPLADLMHAIGSGADRDAQRITAGGYDPWHIARVLVAVNLRHAFRNRFFQVDLHPENVLVLPGDILAFADYSWFAECDPALANNNLAYLSAVFEDDVERMLMPPTESHSDASRWQLDDLRRALLEDVRARELARDAPTAPGAAAAEFLTGLLAHSRATNVAIAAPTQLLFRSMIVAESVAIRLDPESDPGEVGRDYLRVARLDAKLRTGRPDRLESTMLSVATLLREAPGQVQKILSDLADDTFSLNVRVAEVPHVERNRNRRARLTAVAICSVGVAVLLTAPNLPSPLAWLLSGVLAVLYIWLLFEWRRLR
jgi:ubiquinone biosynthesis protein